jgi:hypothetical protein
LPAPKSYCFQTVYEKKKSDSLAADKPMLSNKDKNWTVQCLNIVPKRQIGPTLEPSRKHKERKTKEWKPGEAGTN